MLGDLWQSQRRLSVASVTSERMKLQARRNVAKAVARNAGPFNQDLVFLDLLPGLTSCLQLENFGTLAEQSDERAF